MEVCLYGLRCGCSATHCVWLHGGALPRGGSGGCMDVHSGVHRPAACRPCAQEDIVLTSQEPLGTGAFGTVFAGVYRGHEVTGRGLGA
jgi:hypothetical protein